MGITESVQDYYGKVLKSKDDLQTSACCTADAMPQNLRPLYAKIHDDVTSRYYGCGTPVPPEIEGTTILDLGCGTGQDVYMLSQLVGKDGFVIGVDMTDEQLEVARKHVDWHMEQFGFDKPNVDFRKGFIEDLKAAGIEDNSVDVVISNCVINLSPNKEAVFNEIFRALKPGGELYFSDVYASKPISPELMNDPVLLGECLSGAMHVPTFEAMSEQIGFETMREVKSSAFEISNDDIREKLNGIDFTSITFQLYKPAGCCAPSRKTIGASCCSPKTGCC